jgi:hypothetical protein
MFAVNIVSRAPQNRPAASFFVPYNTVVTTVWNRSPRRTLADSVLDRVGFRWVGRGKSHNLQHQQHGGSVDAGAGQQQQPVRETFDVWEITRRDFIELWCQRGNQQQMAEE